MPTADEQRRWIAQWQGARAALRAQRASELAALSDEDALVAADALLTIASVAGVAPASPTSSGLVQQQALFHRKATS
jgi:hypothetical protein